MCLIIAPGADGKKALLPRETFDYVYGRNDDGFGAMWVADGRVQHFKTLELSKDEIYAKMEELTEEHPDVVFHMRYRTHGDVVPGLCHPFRILHKSRHGKDLFFMHNGVLSSFGNKLSYGQSDTTVFKDKILVPLLTRDPDALDDPEVMNALNKLTSGSRLIFMDSTGKTWRTSESSWNDRYGLTLSNTYMLPSEHSRPTYGGTTTYGGSNNVTTIGYPSKGKAVTKAKEETQVTPLFIYHRELVRDNMQMSIWCSCPKLGYVRGDNGVLYKDQGPDKKLYHNFDAIASSDEHKYLGAIDVNYFDPVSTDTDLDDDVPFDWKDGDDKVAEDKDTKVSGPAPVEMRLRYARLVHNLHNGSVTSRGQLLADLISMGDQEMSDLVLEDPGNSFVIMEELLEIILEMNDALWNIDPNNEKLLDVEMVVEQGTATYHMAAMKKITELRREEYRKLQEAAKEKEKSPAERSAEVFHKVWGPDCEGEECSCANCEEEAQAIAKVA